MITIHAPHPAFTTTIVLPDPSLGDVERLESNVVVRRTLTNEPYSYVVTQPNRRIFLWSFELTRKKALEFEAFVQLHSHQPWKIVTQEWGILICQLKVNPLELNMVARSVIAGSDERVSLDLELEKIQ